QEKSGFGKHAPPYLPTEGGSSITQASMIELESSFPLPTEYSTDLAVSLAIQTLRRQDKRVRNNTEGICHVEPSDYISRPRRQPSSKSS
ncbi:hypothetical protein J6590_093230, partial [Homalodisca vitripennis]